MPTIKPVVIECWVARRLFPEPEGAYLLANPPIRHHPPLNSHLGEYHGDCHIPDGLFITRGDVLGPLAESHVFPGDPAKPRRARITVEFLEDE